MSVEITPKNQKSDLFKETKKILSKINDGEDLDTEDKNLLNSKNFKDLQKDEKDRLSDLAEIILEKKEKNKEKLPAKYEEILSIIEEISELDGVKGDFIKTTNESFEKALSNNFDFPKAFSKLPSQQA